MQPSSPKTAIVTGASRGIGQAIADLVSFLAGPTSSWINGPIIRANGSLA